MGRITQTPAPDAALVSKSTSASATKDAKNQQTRANEQKQKQGQEKSVKSVPQVQGVSRPQTASTASINTQKVAGPEVKPSQGPVNNTAVRPNTGKLGPDHALTKSSNAKDLAKTTSQTVQASPVARPSSVKPATPDAVSSTPPPLANRPTTASNRSSETLSVVKSQIRGDTGSRTSLQRSLDELNTVLRDSKIDPKKRQALQDKVAALQRAIQEQNAENAALIDSIESRSSSRDNLKDKTTNYEREMGRIQRIEKEVVFDRNKDEFLQAVQVGSAHVKGSVVQNDQKREMIGKANMVGQSSEVKERLLEKRDAGKRLTLVEKVALFADGNGGAQRN
ncbi:hypothetical protein BJ742DRAFT_899994 [Cladochytrium replicatum]|nr:hypothetical protein BJ742DRAFT_899994 [Cladochytrium replicatum]